MIVPNGDAVASGSPADPPRRHNLYLRDWVYGGIDGAVTTFAVVAGVVGAALDVKIILVLGFANLVADGFSMAAGSYSSSRAETEEYAKLFGETRRRLAQHPELEERDGARSIMAAHAVVASQVRDPEADQATWARALLFDEQGVAPVVRNPWYAAANTYAAFLVCGFAPLLPYLLGLGFTASAAVTGAVFFAIGSFNSHWTDRSWWASGLRTLFIGGAAATIAYVAGDLLQSIVS